MMNKLETFLPVFSGVGYAHTWNAQVRGALGKPLPLRTETSWTFQQKLEKNHETIILHWYIDTFFYFIQDTANHKTIFQFP